MVVDLRRCLVGVTTLLTTACGGSPSTMPDAAGVPVDASPDAPPLPVIKIGDLLFGEEIQGGVNTTISGAGFGSMEQADSTTTDGPCTIDNATRGTSTVVSAGTITINYGSNQSLMLVPDGQYMYSNIAYQFLYAAGDVLSVSAAGATVPPFTTSVTFPAAVTVTSPTSLSTISQSGFTAMWNPTTSPVHIRINEYLSSTYAIFVDCTYSGTSGTGTISASTLMKLLAGASATFSIFTEATAMTSAADYIVTTDAIQVGFSTNVVVQP